jgi:hypothetical protein
MTHLRPRFHRSSFLATAACAGVLGALLCAASAAHADPPAPATTLKVTAKLVEIPSKLPSDELYDYAYVMKYQVVGGPMDGKSILVAHYKPRLARTAIKDKMKSVVSGKVRSFHEGDTHNLQLTSDVKSVWKGALVDEFAATDRKSVRYFALVADPA